MSDAEALLHLQDIEMGIVRGQKRLNEIAQILADDAQVAQAQAQVTSAQQTLTPLRAKARSLELEIKSNTQKANASEEQLYSGKVRNTKEMQDMQAEVASLRKRNGELEETLLETMLAADEADGALRDAEQSLRQVVEERAGEKRHLLDEQTALQADISGLRKQRESALQVPSPDSLARYNALRPAKKGHPVAIMRGNLCTACGVEQDMAIERLARQGQSLVTCLSCGRILVYKPG
jgi:predicted  nucleic acid-binding Zn-ribbon protein